MFKTVRVPASSANLGPGFDTLGLALDLYLACRFRPASALSIRITGRDAGEIPRDQSNLVGETAAKVAGQDLKIELEIDNQIPLGKGLGSSAAAVVAGVVIGSEVGGLGWRRERVLQEAAKIEGHPDNVSACVLGGLTAAAFDDCGLARAVRLDFPKHFQVAVIVPDFRLATEKARRVLPNLFSREDAIFNLQRSALLLAGLASGNRDVFPDALADRLHQPHRFRLVPGLDEITRLRAPGLLGCALSGAGPSILVFYERGHESVCELAQHVFSANGHESEVLRTSVDTQGLTISQN